MPAGAKTRPTHAAPTLELRVRNMSFLLERLGRDCAPDQFVRELTVNAIQAVQRAGGNGVVAWDHDPVYSRRFGAAKLCIVDTGVGMTGPEMVEYINHLASSAGTQADDGNFGVGAKIAAATRNPAGIVYLSWKRGEGAMVWLWRNPETGQYGLKRLGRGPGEEAYWAPAPPSLKPALIREHGTVVVLLGASESEDTTLPPDGAADDSNRSLWLTRYLNSRFFELPEGVELKAREHWGTPRSRVRPVRGMKHFLDLVSRASGRVRLPDATAHWWILPEEVPQELADRYPSSGHVGALFQGELYELYTGRAGTAKLQSFGIAVGHQRVVLYVEPRVTRRCRVVPNTARTALLVNGRPLPWDEWAEAVPREPSAGDPGADGGGGGWALGAGPDRGVQAADEGAGQPAVHRREQRREPAAAVRARGRSPFTERQAGWRRRPCHRPRAERRHDAEQRAGEWGGARRGAGHAAARGAEARRQRP